MKKLLLFATLLCFSISLFAQDTPDDFANRVRSIFQHVDASQASTGILMDCGAEFVHMDNYTGYTSLNDSNYVNLNTWRGVYASLYSAKFNSNIAFTDFSILNDSLKSAASDALPIPLLLLNYNYQVLRSDAISANLMYASNDQLYDVTNRSQSPYTSKTAFAISPTEDYITAINGYASFIFKSSLMFGNTGKIISTLKIDLGDGQGLQTVQPNIAINTQYSNGGFKTFNYEITYTDYSIYTGHSQVYIDYQQETYTPGGGDMNDRFYSIADGHISVNTSTGLKKATLQIRLSNSNTAGTIQKPFVVVEGIDFWRITTPNNPRRNTNVNDFLGNASLQQLFNGGTLRDSLDLLSYDIIYIDFEDGADYLENNSALTQRAIQWVDSAKTTSTQNVVMGLSMGAVIARHALRTMEINNIPHDTRLYISMDGPHQGGNFPVSLQAMIYHLNDAEFSLFWGALPLFKFKDAFPGLDIGKAVLETPASKQLLTYRVGGVQTLGNGFTIDNSAHDNFYSNYHSMGYPTLCRNIAISNGSECGSNQGYAPLTTIFNKTTSETGGGWVYFTDLVTSGFQFIGGIFTNKPLISLYAPLAVLSTKTSFEIEFDAKALPDHTTDRIYKGRAGITRKILGLFNVNVNIINRSLNAQSSMLPLDTAPGGRADFSNAGSLGIPTDFATLVQVGGFSYIPTVSSLDIGGGNTTINTVQLNSGYSINNPPTSPYNSPFASFVTAVSNTGNNNNNEDHVTFTPRNGSFLLKEIQGNTNVPVSCALFCSASSLIQGLAQICSTPESYTIPNLPTGATVNWSISPASGVASLSTSGNTATLTKTGNGSLQLSATVNSACGNINLPIYDVYAGLPPSPGSTSPSLNPMCPGQIKVVSLLPRAGIDSYLWYTNDSGINVSGNGLSGSIEATAPGTYQLKIRAINSCGYTESTYFVSVRNYGDSRCSGIMYRYSVYPNPAGNEVTVAYVKNDKEQETQKFTKEFSMKLYNDKGKEVMFETNKSKENSFSLNTSKLPEGTYFLHITDDEETIKKQIIIKH